MNGAGWITDSLYNNKNVWGLLDMSTNEFEVQMRCLFIWVMLRDKSQALISTLKNASSKQSSPIWLKSIMMDACFTLCHKASPTL